MSNRRSAKSILTFTCSILALSSAFAQGVQPEAADEETIRGTVVNSVTHEPIGRALVLSTDRFATLTDNEGHFAFVFSTSRDGQAGKMDWTRALTARKPGFVERSQWYTVVRGKEPTIALTPEALVIGHVLLPSSEAPDKIQVEIYRRQVADGTARWVPAGETTTKSNGEFRFADLVAGSYKLFTRELLDRDPLSLHRGGQLFGYPPVYFPNANDFSSAETIQVAAGQTAQVAISLVEKPYYSVKVAITNAPAHAGIMVSVSPQGHRGPGYLLSYNPAGQTIEGLLPSGTYVIAATSGGPTSATGSVTITVKGGAVQGPKLILVYNRAIAVNVKEEFTSPPDGGPQGAVFGGLAPAFRGSKKGLQGPMRYLRLYLDPVDDFDERRRASLGSSAGMGNDSLVVDDVPPGRYWVRVHSSRGYASSVTSGGIDLERQPLVVPSSGPIEITMRDDWAQVDGTVEGSAAAGGAGSPNRSASAESSARVYFVPQPDSPGEFREASVTSEGKFNPAQVPPGLYRALAFDRPQENLEYHDPEAMRAYETQGQLIRLEPGQNQPLRLQVISSE
jgi:hypothetical protein